MKNKVLNTVFLVSAIPLALSCTEETNPSTPAELSCPIEGYQCYHDATSSYVVYGEGYVIKAGENYNSTSTVDRDIIVYPELNFAADAQGNLVGGTNSNCTAILDAFTKEPVVQRVNISELEHVSPILEATTPAPEGNTGNASTGSNGGASGIKYKLVEDYAWVLSGDQTYLIYGSGEVSNTNCEIVGRITNHQGGDIIGNNGNTLYKNVNAGSLPVAKVEDNSKCTSVKRPGNSSTTTASSTARSSSSQATAKSSAGTSNTGNTSTGGCPNIVTKGGGGSGWATRYWDCCKPSCSWNENAGGNPSRQCDAKGKNQNNDYGAQSICSGGNAATCTSQIPFTIDGCSDYGFAFAAVPASNGGQCGKCFQLTFTGEGKYSNDANIAKIKGKKLIIMVTNVGYDVEQGQFDIMIPGGGVGAFNGCSQMGWGNQGKQYGGLLSDCEEETGYSAAAYASCLERKCNDVFANDSEAKNGCLFLATWMKAANNPMHNYVEVECPSVLKSKY